MFSESLLDRYLVSIMPSLLSPLILPNRLFKLIKIFLGFSLIPGPSQN